MDDDDEMMTEPGRVPKFPDEMTDLDCHACHATGRIHVPSDCFGSKSMMCGECRGQGYFTEEQLARKQSDKVLMALAIELATKRNEVIAAARAWSSGDPADEWNAENKLRSILRDLDVLEATKPPETVKWEKLVERRKRAACEICNATGFADGKSRMFAFKGDEPCKVCKGTTIVQEKMTMGDKLAGDEHMGKWVYCTQHVAPHETGWCTVEAKDKIALKATTRADAVVEVKAMGLAIYGEDKG